jgi:hypothetical protein
MSTSLLSEGLDIEDYAVGVVELRVRVGGVESADRAISNLARLGASDHQTPKSNDMSLICHCGRCECTALILTYCMTRFRPDGGAVPSLPNVVLDVVSREKSDLHAHQFFQKSLFASIKFRDFCVHIIFALLYMVFRRDSCRTLGVDRGRCSGRCWETVAYEIQCNHNMRSVSP